MRALSLLVAAVMASGCVAGTELATTATDAPLQPSVAPFSFSAETCEVGGFVSSYAGSMELAGIWRTADIREELGNPVRDSMGMPVIGPLFGNWHIGIECATATGAGETLEDFEFGWVGQMIEAPSWDTGGADKHFLLTGLAFDESPIGEGLRAATTADITHVQEVTLDWLTPKDLPRSAINARFVDVERGVYESWSDMERHGEMPDRVVRFWWRCRQTEAKRTRGISTPRARWKASTSRSTSTWSSRPARAC